MLTRYGIGVRINGQDVGNVVIAGGRIERGRMDALEQPQADICQITVFTRDGWPQNRHAWFEYGAGDNTTAASHFAADHDTNDTYDGPLAWVGIDSEIWVSLTTDTHFSPDHDTEDVYTGAEYRRFTGKVNAFDYTYTRLHIHAVSGLEAWARRGIMEAPETDPPADPTDVDLAEWLAAQAPSPTTLHIEGGDGPVMLPYTDADYPLCLLDALHAIAADADALVYAKRDGNVTYQTRLWDRGAAVDIPPHTVDVDGLAMSMELGTMRNRATVEYGTTDPKPTTTAEDSASIDRYGVRQEYRQTRLANSSGAGDHAPTLLNQYAMGWVMPDLSVRMILATYDEVATVQALDLGHLVNVTQLPAGAPVPEWVGEIVGYSETLSSNDWEIEFHLGPQYVRTTGT